MNTHTCIIHVLMLMMRIQEEIEKQVEHVLSFKSSIKGRRVVDWDRIDRHGGFMYYFRLNPTYHDRFFRRRDEQTLAHSTMEAHDPCFQAEERLLRTTAVLSSSEMHGSYAEPRACIWFRPELPYWSLSPCIVEGHPYLASQPSCLASTRGGNG